MKRRTLLKQLGLSALLPLRSPMAALAEVGCQSNRRAVVTIFLRGGLHGLSLLVPRNISGYLQRHPTLAVNEPIVLNQVHGLNPLMTHLHALYQQGKASLMYGAGYPGHSQSHAEASTALARAIVNAAPGGADNTGWIGRYAQQYCGSGGHLNLVSVGDGIPVEFAAEGVIPASIGGQGQYGLYSVPSNFSEEDVAFLFENMAAMRYTQTPPNSDISRMQESWASIESAMQFVNQILEGVQNNVTYPSTEIGNRLSRGAKLLMSSAITVKHLHISHSGYDTHSNQASTLNGLLSQLDAAIGAFVQDLSIAGRFDDIVINIRSEFGRTFENASYGTDHGQGTTEIVIGTRVRAGVASPDYTAADFAGNWVPVKFDSREVLEQILIHHLNVDPGPVLPESFQRIGLQLFV